jgi:hypothetical protein
MSVRQAIRLTFYTTRSLKRDETAGYIRLVHSTGEGDPDTVMCNAECDGLGSDRSPMESDTNVGKSGRRLFRLRQLDSRGKLPARIPRLEAI